MMRVSLGVGDIVIIDEKDISYIDFSNEYSYVTVFYLVGSTSEEVDVYLCREVPSVEGVY